MSYGKPYEKSLGFTRHLETVSCPEQAVFFDGQAFRGDPFYPTYIASDNMLGFTRPLPILGFSMNLESHFLLRFLVGSRSTQPTMLTTTTEN